MVDLYDVARRVYGAPLSGFVAARKREVDALKADGETGLASTVSALRKPTVGAWTVNQLVRSREGLLDEVADLGERLRAAQGSADGSAIRALTGERKDLVARCLDEARTVAKEHDQLPTPAVLADVEETVKAALVDPDAARMVREGLLVRPLSPAGFGSVDLTDALALPDRAPDPDAEDEADDRDEPTALAAARDRAAAAHDALESARSDAKRVDKALVAAQEDERRAGERLERLKAEVAEAEQDLARGRTRVADLTADGRQAEQAVRKATSAVERAEARVDRLS